MICPLCASKVEECPEVNARMVIVRGLPGSGKTTYAHQVARRIGGVVLEGDQFFTRESGYQYQSRLSDIAHAWRAPSAAYWLYRGVPVIIAGTMTQRWEVLKYAEIAERMGCPWSVIRCSGKFGTVHPVPVEKQAQMAAQWEDFDGEMTDEQGGINERPY